MIPFCGLGVNQNNENGALCTYPNALFSVFSNDVSGETRDQVKKLDIITIAKLVSLFLCLSWYYARVDFVTCHYNIWWRKKPRLSVLMKYTQSQLMDLLNKLRCYVCAHIYYISSLRMDEKYYVLLDHSQSNLYLIYRHFVASSLIRLFGVKWKK